MVPTQHKLNQTMLDAGQLGSLQQAVQGYSPLQLAWASGYLAAQSELVGYTPAVQAAAAATLTILYASQTGNAKGVASKLAEAAKTAGMAVNLKNVADYKAKTLKSETHLLLVTSTNGEGEPPDDALEFHEFLMSGKAPKLDNLHYSVLALGDSSYEFFCQTGKDFDERLQALGATRIADRVDCDVDYQQAAATWSEQRIEQLQTLLPAVSAEHGAVVNFPGVVAPAASQYDKDKPFAAELLVSQKITGRDSNKDVRHIEIDLSGSGLQYQPGDALGVWFENDAALVDELLSLLSLPADEPVSLAGETLALAEALTTKLELTQTSASFVQFWAGLSQNEHLQAVSADKEALRLFAGQHQVVDVVRQAPATVTAQALVDSLRQLTPRLYSIASSQAEVEEEVHLTVGVVSYQMDDQQRFGGASGFLAQRLEQGGKVKVFVEHNHNFRLPENDEVSVIMIGPGTGVAPFRAFMQEREARGAQGKNWMFFGDQTFTQDFLYQVEWQNYLKSGLLSKMDVAFSRDQAEKVYVQHRLLEQAEQVFAWLQQGAHLYLCGDANRMAKDVHQALVAIVAEQGEMSNEQAESYLKSLRSAKRYQKDVY